MRISDRGTFVDGEAMSRVDAVAHCKRAVGGAVVIAENKTEAIEIELGETKSALEREGIRVYVRGQLCDRPDGDDCRPHAKPIQPKREIQPSREIPTP